MFTKKETKKVGGIYKQVKVADINKTQKKTDWESIGGAVVLVVVVLVIIGAAN